MIAPRPVRGAHHRRFPVGWGSSSCTAAWLLVIVIVARAPLSAADEPKQHGERLMLLSADGEDCRELCFVPGYPSIGSPTFSPDGALVALDGIAPGAQLGDTKLLVIRADGADLRVLGDGMMPSWSADGKRIAFSRSGSEKYGVWVIDASGDPATARQIDKEGWGIQWSPDGRF